MIEPRPSQFGLTQQQVDALASQIALTEALQGKPAVQGKDCTTTVAFLFSVTAWGIYVLVGGAPTGSAKFVAGIVAYFTGLIWVVSSTRFIYRRIFRMRARKIASALLELQDSPLYSKFFQYSQECKQYGDWVERVEAERKKAQAEWDRWQRQWSKSQAAFWLALDGISFERELANLYQQLGYEASLTSWSGDDGVDINLKKDGRTIVVQCKAHHKPISGATVCQLFGSLHHFN